MQSKNKAKVTLRRGSGVALTKKEWGRLEIDDK